MPNRLASAERVLGSPIRNLVSILAFVGVVMILATAGYMAAGWSFADASYMVILTVYTVGYGEVRPIDTPFLHLVTVGLMVLGCTGMILLTSALVQLFTVLQLREMFGATKMQNRIDELNGHALICGYGRIGVMLAKELSDAGMPLIILERSTARLAEAEAAGYLCLGGDATEETALISAGILRARVLATVLPDDAANVFITLSARNLNPKLEIFARGEAPTTEGKLRHAGADQVVMPTHIGAERIARLILFPASGNLLGEEKLQGLAADLEGLGLSVELIAVAERSRASRMTIAEAEREGGGAFLIVQIDRGQGGVLVRPARDERLAAGDKVAIVAHDAARAYALFTAQAKVRAGRNVF